MNKNVFMMPFETQRKMGETILVPHREHVVRIVVDEERQEVEQIREDAPESRIGSPDDDEVAPKPRWGGKHTRRSPIGRSRQWQRKPSAIEGKEYKPRGSTKHQTVVIMSKNGYNSKKARSVRKPMMDQHLSIRRLKNQKDVQNQATTSNEAETESAKDGAIKVSTIFWTERHGSQLRIEVQEPGNKEKKEKVPGCVQVPIELVITDKEKHDAVCVNEKVAGEKDPSEKGGRLYKSTDETAADTLFKIDLKGSNEQKCSTKDDPLEKPKTESSVDRAYEVDHDNSVLEKSVESDTTIDTFPHERASAYERVIAVEESDEVSLLDVNTSFTSEGSYADESTYSEDDAAIMDQGLVDEKPGLGSPTVAADEEGREDAAVASETKTTGDQVDETDANSVIEIFQYKDGHYLIVF